MAAAAGAGCVDMSSFARSGDPNNAALGVTWTAWPSTLVFDATLTSKAIHVE
jgi:para-nitrobenzyl esterase